MSLGLKETREAVTGTADKLVWAAADAKSAVQTMAWLAGIAVCIAAVAVVIAVSAKGRA